MNLSLRAVTCLVLVGAAAGAVCPGLNFVGNVKQFVVEQENGKNRRTVPAVERMRSAKAFYDYYSWSSHTGFEQEETSVMFLYRNLNLPNELSFFWIHGIDDGIKGRQERATVNGLVTGVPQGTKIAEEDDAGEWGWTRNTVLGNRPSGNGPHLGGKWNFIHNTDGGAMDGLPMDKNWELKIEAQFVRGIDNWYFYFGDGSEPLKLDMREPVYLHPVMTSVDLNVAPYPLSGIETFCTLAQSESESTLLTFTFQWGDGTPDTIVQKDAGELACAEHNFCGPISDTCGGTYPRKVRVLVDRSGCDGIERVLADESINTCSDLSYVGNVKQFVVEQENGKNRRTVPAVERTKTAQDFYDYRSASSHTGFEREETSVMFLYRNLNLPNELSFFWIHGIDAGIKGSQERATVNGLITGVPQGAGIAQVDDHTGEWGWTSNTNLGAPLTRNGPHLGGKWNFIRNTDGGAMDGLPVDKDWELKIQAQFVRGIHNWYFHFGDGSEPLKLDMREPVYLRPVVTSTDMNVAPYPSEAGLETFCTLVQSQHEAERLTFTFMWGDDTPHTVVDKKAGELACAEHNFCGPISTTCGGVAPRSVRVIVSKAGCVGFERVLAEEDTCGRNGIVVKVNGERLTNVPVGSDTFSHAHVVLSRIPDFLQSMQAFVPEGDVAAGSTITVHCCGTEVCDIVLSHYHCPPCSGSVNGGFPSLLPISGFQSGACSPRYGMMADKMVSHRRQLDAGSSISVETTALATSFVVFGQQGALDEPWCPLKPPCVSPCPPAIPCECRR